MGNLFTRTKAWIFYFARIWSVHAHTIQSTTVSRVLHTITITKTNTHTNTLSNQATTSVDLNSNSVNGYPNPTFKAVKWNGHIFRVKQDSPLSLNQHALEQFLQNKYSYLVKKNWCDIDHSDDGDEEDDEKDDDLKMRVVW